MDDRIDPEIALSIAYAPSSGRRILETIWALDAQLGEIVRSTSEPMIGAMRLTWWRDAIEALDAAPAPAEPLLKRLQADLAGRGIGRLAEMPEGWIALLDPLPLPPETLGDYARQRGAVLFGEIARLLDKANAQYVDHAGEGWALVDFAFACSDRTTAETALDMALPLLDDALASRWAVPIRPLGMLAHLARRDAKAGLDHPRRQGAPGRLIRAFGHRLTGR